MIAFVARNDPTERTIRHEVHKLGEYGPANCHANTSRKVETKNNKTTLKDMVALESRTGNKRSNRLIPKNLEELHHKLTGHHCLWAMKEVAVGILRGDGKVLACQRKRNAVYPLKWEFPGGKVEPGESPAEALRRELREELGIEAVPGKEFHRQDWVYPEGVTDPKKDGSFRVFYFLVESYTGDPANHAFEQIRWVTFSELGRLDILEGNREAVEILLDDEKVRR